MPWVKDKKFIAFSLHYTRDPTKFIYFGFCEDEYEGQHEVSFVLKYVACTLHERISAIFSFL